MSTAPVVLALLATLSPFPAVSSGGLPIPSQQLPTCPATDAIAVAASISDPQRHDIELRQAISVGLLESDRDTASLVFSYLSDASRWLDLRPFDDILMQFAEVSHSHSIAWLLDQAEVPRMPRDERLRVYAEAIVNGSVTLRHGWPMARQTAIRLASDDGLAELRPLIEAHYGEMAPEVQRATPLAEALVRLDLGAGASDREDAARLASERLAAMSDVEFRDRMDADAAFRTVVETLSSFVCRVDPFRARRNPGCASIKSVVKRQVQVVENAAHARALAAGTGLAAPQESEDWHMTWLGHMQDASAGELRAARPH
jgi:hypothetical protein